MPSGLVTEWIMHNKPPKEFTHTKTHALLVTIATTNSSGIAALNLNVRHISASQPPGGATGMAEHFFSDFLTFLPYYLNQPVVRPARQGHKNKPRNAWLG